MANHDCQYVRALGVSPAAQGFTIGSHEIDELAPYPLHIPVRAIAAAVTLQADIGLWSYPVPMGDLVVGVKSQLLLHTDDRLGGTRTVNCGAVNILFDEPHCWHITETAFAGIQHEVRQAITDYLTAHPTVDAACQHPPSRSAARSDSSRPWLQPDPVTPYFYDLFEVMGCQGSYALVQASHTSGSFFGYWVLTSQNGNWQIRAQAGVWGGASAAAAVFAPGELAKAGLDEAAVVAALGRFSKRPLVGACTAAMAVLPAC